MSNKNARDYKETLEPVKTSSRITIEMSLAWRNSSSDILTSSPAITKSNGWCSYSGFPGAKRNSHNQKSNRNSQQLLKKLNRKVRTTAEESIDNLRKAHPGEVGRHGNGRLRHPQRRRELRDKANPNLSADLHLARILHFSTKMSYVHSKKIQSFSSQQHNSFLFRSQNNKFNPIHYFLQPIKSRKIGIRSSPRRKELGRGWKSLHRARRIWVAGNGAPSGGVGVAGGGSAAAADGPVEKEAGNPLNPSKASDFQLWPNMAFEVFQAHQKIGPKPIFNAG